MNGLRENDGAILFLSIQNAAYFFSSDWRYRSKKV